MAITTRHPQVANRFAWGSIVAVVLVFAAAFAGAYWLLDNDGDGGSTAVAPRTGTDGIIPVGAEMSRPVLGSDAGDALIVTSAPAVAEQTVYIVRSDEQRQVLLAAEQEANLIRAHQGLPHTHHQYIVVELAGSEAFVNGMREANLTRYFEGLAQLEIVDLR